MELVQVLQYVWGPLTKLPVWLGVERSSTVEKVQNWRNPGHLWRQGSDTKRSVRTRMNLGKDQKVGECSHQRDGF